MTRTDTTTRAVCELVEREIGWYGLRLPDGEPTVTADTRLDDMGADSLDRLELSIAVELAFDIETSDDEWAAVETVADIVGIVERARTE